MLKFLPDSCPLLLWAMLLQNLRVQIWFQNRVSRVKKNPFLIFVEIQWNLMINILRQVRYLCFPLLLPLLRALLWKMVPTLQPENPLVCGLECTIHQSQTLFGKLGLKFLKDFLILHLMHPHKVNCSLELPHMVGWLFCTTFLLIIYCVSSIEMPGMKSELGNCLKILMLLLVSFQSRYQHFSLLFSKFRLTLSFCFCGCICVYIFLDVFVHEEKYWLP